MERKTALAIGAGVILVAALAVVIVLEASNTPAPTLAYPVSWSVVDGGTSQRSDQLQEEESAEYAFQLSSSNITRVRVELTWEDDVGQPDTFNLSVQRPGGGLVTRQGENGSLVLSFRPAQVPELATVQGEREEQAREELSSVSTRAGTGTWQVTVTLTEAPGQRPLPGAPQVETQPDGQNRFQLTFTHEVFRGQLGDPSVQS